MKPCSDDDVRLSCNSLENSRNTIKLGDCNFPCTLSLRQPNKSGSEQSVGNANEVIIWRSTKAFLFNKPSFGGWGLTGRTGGSLHLKAGEKWGCIFNNWDHSQATGWTPMPRSALKPLHLLPLYVGVVCVVSPFTKCHLQSLFYILLELGTRYVPKNGDGNRGNKKKKKKITNSSPAMYFC